MIDEIRSLRDLDNLVAEKVMGWKHHELTVHPNPSGAEQARCSACQISYYIPPWTINRAREEWCVKSPVPIWTPLPSPPLFSFNREAAWSVLEKLAAGDWVVNFALDNTLQVVYARWSRGDLGGCPFTKENPSPEDGHYCESYSLDDGIFEGVFDQLHDEISFPVAVCLIALHTKGVEVHFQLS